MQPVRSFGVFLLVPALLCLSGCGVAKGLKPAQATSVKFLTKLQAKRFADAHQLCSGKCQAVVTPEQLENYWELVQKNRGQVTSWTHEGTHFQMGTGGSSITLVYRLKCEKGESAVQFTLVQEGDQWLIQRFDFRG